MGYQPENLETEIKGIKVRWWDSSLLKLQKRFFFENFLFKHFFLIPES